MALPRSLFNTTSGVAGGTATSQFPEFYQQYLQRLGGRLDQALIQMNQIEKAAAEEGLSLDAYISHFLASDDSVVRSQGTIMLEQVEQLSRMQEAMDALLRAPIIQRPLTFAEYVDQGVMDATTAAFVPAMPVTVEGLAYAVVGFMLGLIVLASFAGLFRSVWPKAA